MTWILILIMFCILGGIFCLTFLSSTKKKTREQLLEELAHYLEGELVHSQEFSASSRINFKFEGKVFIFEEVEEKALKEKFYKGYLRLRTNTELTLGFIDKGRPRIVTGDVLLASNISAESAKNKTTIYLPKGLDNFEVYANNPKLANEFLADRKVIQIFSEFKNFDSRGYPSMPLKIVDGMIVLEFSSVHQVHPSLISIYQNIPSIEPYLHKMIVLSEKLECF